MTDKDFGEFRELILDLKAQINNIDRKVDVGFAKVDVGFAEVKREPQNWCWVSLALNPTCNCL